MPRAAAAGASRDLVVPAGSALIAVVAVLLWWAASTATFVIPSPASTVSALVDTLGQAEYWQHIRSTALASTLAFGLSIVVGTILGLLLGLVPFVRHVFEPMAVALNGVPKIVLFPVLLLFFGLGIVSKMTMGILIGLFPVMMNVSAGIRSIPPVYPKLAESLCASRWQTFWQVIVPAIRRPFMTGVRLAVSLSMVGVVLAEIFATRYGLGRVILARYGSGQYAGMLATVLLLLIISFLVTFLMWTLEKRVR
jgi:NitT/TauT family transport system permease protein